jgi:hypothetical protein
VSTPMGHGHGGFQLVMVGRNLRPETCQSPFVVCYPVAAGVTTAFGWCISSTGNCSSGIYAGKVKWTNDNGCGLTKGLKLKNNKCVGSVKSKWGPPANLVGIQTDSIIVKSNVRSTKGVAGYDVTWNACATTGMQKGSCFGPVPTGVIVGSY